MRWFDRLVDNPRGLVVIRDELAAWVEGMNSYKGGKGADESAWLSFFDGREAKHDRKSAKRSTLFVPHAAVSLVGRYSTHSSARMLNGPTCRKWHGSETTVDPSTGNGSTWSDVEGRSPEAKRPSTGSWIVSITNST